MNEEQLKLINDIREFIKLKTDSQQTLTIEKNDMMGGIPHATITFYVKGKK